MRHHHQRLHGLTRAAFCLALASFLGSITACSTVATSSASSTTSTTTSSSTTPGPQNYFAPPLGSSSGVQLFTIDDLANTFSEADYVDNASSVGAQIVNAGVVAPPQGGLRPLNITASYALSSGSDTYVVTDYPANNPETGSFAVELANQAGGLVQMLGQPALPIVAATQCPSSSAQTYQFITIPSGLNTASVVASSFNPAAETAYGSVGIVSSGSKVTLQDIQQYILPAAVGAGSAAPQPPQQPSPSSVPGSCAPTVLGNTTVVPPQLVVSNPGASSFSTTPQASIGIGPSGLLVEYNGAGTRGTGAMTGSSPGLYYDNVLGAGVGAVGLPKSSSALSTSALTAAQYVGFIYSAGVYMDSSNPSQGESSYAASFGGSTPPSGCLTPDTTTTAPLYGGDFPSNNPAKSSSAYGNCDFLLDLGAPQDSSNSLYPSAKVTIGANYAGNPTKAQYSFNAVAIAGTLGGKYAIFVIGYDANSSTPPPQPQPWAIYLLQSN